MARNKISARKKTKAVGSKKNDRGINGHLSSLLEQMREPLGLIETLKDEGIARASYLMGVAAHMAGSVTKENVKAQAQEIVKTLGLVRRHEFDSLKKRVAELERNMEQGKVSHLEEE